jgi:hypothetical protein
VILGFLFVSCGTRISWAFFALIFRVTLVQLLPHYHLYWVCTIASFHSKLIRAVPVIFFVQAQFVFGRQPKKKKRLLFFFFFLPGKFGSWRRIKEGEVEKAEGFFMTLFFVYLVEEAGRKVVFEGL